MLSTNGNHNLDIYMYSFVEILNLFDIKDSETLTLEKMQQAKNKVMKTHPDKSGLPSQYFLFYKKAFDIVHDHFKQTQKCNVKISQEPLQYTPPSIPNSKVIQRNVHSDKHFQKTFNELFEKYEMGGKIKTDNQWFHEKEDTSATTTIPKNSKEIHSHISKMKETIRQDAIIKRGEFQDVIHTQQLQCFDLYETDENDKNTPISSDVFAKLKYDDIKRVHRDETVFLVDESDYDHVEKYNSVKDYEVAREKCDLAPHSHASMKEIEIKKAQIKMLEQKAFESRQRAELMAKKNAEISSYFLRIE